MPLGFNPAPFIAANMALQMSRRQRQKTQQEQQTQKASPCRHCYHRSQLTSIDVLACKSCVDGSHKNKEV
jgi:hypothetical protein